MTTKPTVDSPVHATIVLDAEGEARVIHRVFCRRSNESVAAHACKQCPWAVGWPATLGSPDAAIRCHASIPPPSAPTADLRERAIRTVVGDLLERKLVCVREDADMEMLGRLLGEDGLAVVPVVDAHGHPKGIVHQSDVLQALRDKDELTAHQLMVPAVQGLHEGAPVSFALAMLAAEDLNEVPIVSKDGVVVGMFTARDAVRWVARELGYTIPTR